MPEDQGAARPDERLTAQIAQRRLDRVRGRVARTGIIGVIATTLVLEVFAAGGAVAGPLRHQHGIAARHQPCRQRAIFRLRHLRTTRGVLRRVVRDQRQRKRPIAGGAKQQRMGREVGIGRRHQPLLPPVRLAFRPLRPELGLGVRTLRIKRAENDQGGNSLEELH